MSVQLQSAYPEIVFFEVPDKQDLNRKLTITKRVGYNGNFVTKVDTSRKIGQGSFGTIFPCSLELISDGVVTKRENNMIFKIIKNIPCDLNEQIKQEIQIQSLLWKTMGDNIPKIYGYMFAFFDSSMCYNGLLIEKITNGDVTLFKNKLCNTYKTPRLIVNNYFGMINEIKHNITKFYDLYKFKHNDLHMGNVMFENFHQKLLITESPLYLIDFQI